MSSLFVGTLIVPPAPVIVRDRNTADPYEVAINRGFGVGMFASSLLSDSTCASVYGPADEKRGSETSVS